VGVRVELLNENRRLRPGDFGEARIHLPIGLQGDVYDADLAGRWISPMHPQIIRDEPGHCPICGMDLVPTAKYGYSERPTPQPEVMHIPRSAVLMAGERSVVYVESEPGRFEIRPVTLGPILKDQVVILAGLTVGDEVATAGNFLIDSQMQLAGKPSLIDTSRLGSAESARSAPQANAVAPQAIEGDAGQQLEALFAAYFRIQQALASDQAPGEDARPLHALAVQLATDFAANSALSSALQEIARYAEHLHHADLTAVRQQFKQISAAVLKIARQARGAGATTTFTLFHCPMAPQGGGDWLQPNDRLLNPYFGSQMLRCGEIVEQLSPPQESPTAESTETESSERLTTPHAHSGS
jgi:Cu(I)/Ag(I) efflux system membrane fusion protein